MTVTGKIANLQSLAATVRSQGKHLKARTYETEANTLAAGLQGYVTGTQTQIKSLEDAKQGISKHYGTPYTAPQISPAPATPSRALRKYDSAEHNVPIDSQGLR